MKKTLTFSVLGLVLFLASCNQATPQTTSLTPPTTSPSSGSITTGAGTLSPLGIASATSISVGQTRQFNVTVNGTAPTPGQLVWTSTSTSVVTVTQSGLATALTPGSATVRAALASNPGAYTHELHLCSL